MRKNYISIFTILFIYSFGFSQEIPLDFSVNEDSFTTFGNSGFSFRNAPNDNSNRVGQFARSSEVTQGFYIDLAKAINLDTQKELTLSFYSFDPNNHNILLKLEQGDNNPVQVKQSFNVPSTPDWVTVTFNFSNAKDSSTNATVNASGNYSRLTIFIDENSTVPGTFLIDDITDGSPASDPNELDVIYTDLVWSDEFTGTGNIDTSKWYHQTFGPNGGQWFNGELQHYTNSNTNSFMANGNLNIVAKKETKTQNGVTLNYTSARLNSKYAFTYGRVDVRAQLPEGDGTWPAIWTLGKNITETGAYWQTQGFGTTNWPACGEIDIMEHGLHATNTVSSALHTTSSSGNTMNTATKSLSDVANNFHVYSMNWSPNQITFLIDNVAYYTYKPSTKNNATWPFDLDQFLLLNIAMGGYSGTPDSNFTETRMLIDYVRVYQNTSTAGIDESFSNKFSVHPNPTSNYLNIKTNEVIDKIELYSVLGQLVFKKETAIKNIDTRTLKVGLYLMKIYSDNKIVSKKVIVR